MFKIEDLKELYRMRWEIETNYNTLKNRFYIENYTGKRRITIEQDIYSKFLRFNITKYGKIPQPNHQQSQKKKRNKKQIQSRSSPSNTQAKKNTYP